MKEEIIDKYGSLLAFAQHIDVSPQRLNYWIKRGDKLNPILFEYIRNSI